MSSIKETPERRAQKKNSEALDDVPDWMKTRVANKSPRGKRCLIEGVSEEKASNVCHVCAKMFTSKESVMRGIEYHTDKKLGTMNLNCSGNLFYANAAAHWLFDHARYTLLPSDEILNLFLKPYLTRGTFGDVWKKAMALAEYGDDDQNTKTPLFEYTLVPLMHKLEGVILVHEHEGTPGQQDVTVHHYPYNDFPKIKSHIHPHYLLLSLGYLLKEKEESELEILERDFSPSDRPVPFLEISLLYKFWIKAPNDWMHDTSFCDAGKPFPEEKDDPKDKSYKASGSVTSSMRTQQKRNCTGLIKTPGVTGDGPSSPSRSSFAGDGGSDLGSQLERRSKKARRADGGSQRGD